MRICSAAIHLKKVRPYPEAAFVSNAHECASSDSRFACDDVPGLRLSFAAQTSKLLLIGVYRAESEQKAVPFHPVGV